MEIGFNQEMVCSEKGKVMIENQRDSRRQRHIAALKECEKFVEQFYDNFKEKKIEIKEKIKIFLSGTDYEIDQIMKGITDELLLANEIAYVNGIWEKVGEHRQARKEAIQHLRDSFDNLKVFQKKGSGGYLDSMRKNLIEIAFCLEPAVDELIQKWINEEKIKYELEHQECTEFHLQVVDKENEKFVTLYQIWKDSVVRFHILKQEDAISKFLDKVNSKKFVNPQTRVDIFTQVKQCQQEVFNKRLNLIDNLMKTSISTISKDLISNIDDNLKGINEDAQQAFDKLVEQLAKDMENTNEDLDIAVYDLKDFILKNDAQLEEGMTFDLIIELKAIPTINRRKLESKTLITNSVKYMEELDVKMNDICQNIVNLFKELATKLDSNKDKLKTTEITFQVALASCGDNNDEITQQLEDDLTVKVDEMKRAIHHIQLNEKLQECFNMLDKITKQYRTYNVEYIEIVNKHPQTMDAFYKQYEKDCVQIFKMQDEEKRSEIQALFIKETEIKQKIAEEEALKKFEEDKKMEEAKKAEEDKENLKQGKQPQKVVAKAPPQQKKGGKEADKLPYEVPKIEVPKIIEYTTQMGNKYLIERNLDQIADKLMLPIVEEDKKQEKEEVKPVEIIKEVVPIVPVGKQAGKEPLKKDDKVQQKQVEKPVILTKEQQQQQLLLQQQKELQEQQENERKLQAERKAQEIANNFKPNNFLEKAQMYPPQDPDGDLTNYVKDMLTQTLNKTLEYLYIEKTTYSKKIQRESKDLIDKNVDDLDENLRKQWPRKGKLEVEIFQERKSQITAHIKKYENKVRQCLEKYNMLEEQWSYVLESIDQGFVSYQQQQDKLRGFLPAGKNLAELQGVSRKEKDSNQTFEEKCREYQDKMYDISITQPDILIQQNDDMIKSCQLFEKGGNYSEPEVQWYRDQMKEINQMLDQCKQQRDLKQKEIHLKMEKLMKEPYEVFDKNYKGSILNLSAKEGLGKTFGQPRRIAQEKLRGEMTKCEQAQKGIDQLIDKLEELCYKQFEGYYNNSKFDYSKEKISLSTEIRVTLVSIVRCIIHYGLHLNGFVKEPKQLPRITYLEIQPQIDLQPTEIPIDEKRKEEELENLGAIGFKNVTQAYLKFNESLALIEKQSKELCPKLYTGENVKFLVGTEKIPEYLTIFMEGMRRQAEEFRISSVRLLRISTLRHLDLCQSIPKAVFGYLGDKYKQIIENLLQFEDQKFNHAKQTDDATKKNHLKLFRPNLQNPANKQLTIELNNEEIKRTETYKELIDEIQLKMLDIEQENSLAFYNAYLNNVRGFIKIYDCLLVKEDFILLPGDEIIEKKHQNIKILTAQAQKQDISKRSTRKWPGLGKNVFDIDYPSLFEQFKEFKKEEPEVPVNEKPLQAQNLSKQQLEQQLQQQQLQDAGKKTELSEEVEIQNTLYHKSIIKARNENYEKYQKRFSDNIRRIMERFDAERKEEVRFNNYWTQNLKEITSKHI